MKPLQALIVIVCLVFLAAPAAVLAEEPLLHGSTALAATPTDSQVATWLAFRYDSHKEMGVSLPGQKDFQAWLVSGRCHWLEGLNLAAGYEIWSPNLAGKDEIRTTRGGISFERNNKAAALSVERSSYAGDAREPSYGAIAAFTMQF